MRHRKRDLALGLLRNPSTILRRLRRLEVSEFSPEEISRYLPEGAAVVIEAGAFDGRDTEMFRRLWPTAQVFAFEPIPELTEVLQHKFAGDDRVFVVPQALVGDESDSVVINSYAEDALPHASSSILQPGEHLDLAPSIKFDRRISVPAISLDRFIRESDIERIDLLWLDLQGAEVVVLAGASHTLARTSVIHIEVSRRPLYHGAASLHDVRTLLESHGFTLKRLRAPFVMGNAIFIKKDSPVS